MVFESFSPTDSERPKARGHYSVHCKKGCMSNMSKESSPAALAAALTAAKPGMSGPRTGSMMISESRDLPTRAASPVRMPAICRSSGLCWQQSLTMLSMLYLSMLTARMADVCRCRQLLQQDPVGFLDNMIQRSQSTWQASDGTSHAQFAQQSLTYNKGGCSSKVEVQQSECCTVHHGCA